MISPALCALDFRLSYGPGDDRLNAFYIPALAASIRYDRMTGCFSSYSLAIAAAGVAHLIANGGRMRLLVGAQLSREGKVKGKSIRPEAAALEGIRAAFFEELEVPAEEEVKPEMVQGRLL